MTDSWAAYTCLLGTLRPRLTLPARALGQESRTVEASGVGDGSDEGLLFAWEEGYDAEENVSNAGGGRCWLCHENEAEGHGGHA